MSPSPAVLVIGASGAIGSALINELIPDHQVGRLRLVAATRKEEAARSLRERGIEVRHLDLDVAETGGLLGWLVHSAWIIRLLAPGSSSRQIPHRRERTRHMAAITVLGGTGYTGTNVVRAAAARGHAVTSVSRSLPAEKVDGVTYVQSSVTEVDPASLVTASDVVVGALSPNSGELAGKLGATYQSLAPAVAAMGTRLVIIGGFSALRRVAGGPRIAFSEDVNPLFAAAAREMAAIADWLLTTPAELAWTYISPASAYGVRNPGAARGRYRLGGDVALTDAEGRSDVSGTDFASAIVDLIDSREHYCAHISVAY